MGNWGPFLVRANNYWGLSRNLLISGWRSSPNLRDDGGLLKGVVEVGVPVEIG